MRINSFGPRKTPQTCLELAAGGLGAAAIGAPAAAAGWHLGQELGPDLVQIGIRHAVPLMQSGWISPHTLLTWGPKALHPVVQAQAGALLLGSLGVVAGVLIGVGLARS